VHENRKTEDQQVNCGRYSRRKGERGRFLERNAEKQVWYDIGDKKAIEKTSQALREGQPKLRKKMVELGQLPVEQIVSGGGMNPAVQQHLLQQQYGNGIYNTRASLPPMNTNISMNNEINMLLNAGVNINSIGAGMNMNNMNGMGVGSGMNMNSNMNRNMNMNMNMNMNINNMGVSTNMNNMNGMGIGSGMNMNSNMNMNNINNMNNIGTSGMSAGNFPNSSVYDSKLYQEEKQMMGRNNTGQLRNSMVDMPPPPVRTMSNGMIDNNDLAMLQNLSLDSKPPSIPSWTPSVTSVESTMAMSLGDVSQRVPTRNRSRTYNRKTSREVQNNKNKDSFEYGTVVTNDTGSNSIEPNFIREKIGSFDPSEQSFRQERQQSYSRSGHSKSKDGQLSPKSDPRSRFARLKSPRIMDIDIVDSQISLMSNLSAHGSKNNGVVVDMVLSNHGVSKKDSTTSIGVASRRSLMSGLSKYSGHSIDISHAFSNLSRKFSGTNHTMSSRSLAMSEFSGLGDGEEEFGEEDFDYNLPSTEKP